MEAHNLLQFAQFQESASRKWEQTDIEHLINCIPNNKGDTDQTYFKMTVGASYAFLQVTCPLPSPVHFWNSHLKTLASDQQGGAGSFLH